MKLISNLEQILQNIKTVENYLTDGTSDEQLKISKFIQRGTCFIAYQIENEIRFAPSKFLGYINNSLEKHIPSETDGRNTNEMIINILETNPFFYEKLENEYIAYCQNLGLQPRKKGAFGVQRKYWLLKLEKDFLDNEELLGEFPEGKIVERIHKSRERNSKVIEIAKQNFKNKYGKLFCHICHFDFEEKYGSLGKDFIEAHHTIPVSKMKTDHKTKPEEIAMLCSNCHKMVHKKRPWLEMENLSNIINGQR
ncbi:HNH endonuclease [Flavobacterium sp. XS2P39]|uniref:HNH endonuclease n=1 Tax=Flavobacterium sp. XS2P39 TaxID=3401725 RepID=UPI003AAB12E5